MTLGEKIRMARKNCGFSQEQLADKLAVSRSAVAKWETDKGLPDVGNLKILARLLGVSVDHLLDEEETETVIREPYCLEAYGRGCKKVKKDRFICERFPDAKIYPLFARQETTEPEAYTAGTPDCCKQLRISVDQSFYLVEKGTDCLLVTVTDTVMEVRTMEQDAKWDHFSRNGWHFVKCNYELTI